MSTNLSSVPKLQFFDANGNPLAGGKLYTYAAGTTTPLATYTDSTGLTPNTNPIILDSRGEANVWLDATQYKFELTTAADALIWTVDNISNALNLSQLLASSGSAAAPPYTFAADPTTGMYLQAVGQIGLSANGKPVLRSTDVTMVIGQIGGADDVDVTLYGDLALAGNMAITGTGRRITGDFSNATHANRVMFQSSTTNGFTLVGALPNGTSTNSGFQAYATSSGLENASIGQFAAFSTEVAVSSVINGTGTYLPMTFYTGGSERVRVNTSGNVGIGTSSPGAKLVVEGAGETSAPAVGGTKGATIFAIDTTNSAGAGGGIEFGGKTGQTFVAIKGGITDGGNNGSGYLSFYTRPVTSSSSMTEAMRIDSSGNVGIGTSSFSGRLNVVDPSIGIVAAFSSADATTNAIGRVNLYNNVNTGISFGSYGSNYSGGSVFSVGANGTAIWSDGAAPFAIGTFGVLQPLIFGTNSTERMRIDSSGNVGIGTSSPSTILHAVTAGGNSVGTFGNGTITAQVGVTSAGSGQAIFGSTTNHLTRLIQNGTTQAQITTAGLFQIDNGYGSLATFYGCRAWINFNGTGTPAARASGNVSSITDNGTGDYTINFTTAMPDGNYAPVFGYGQSESAAADKFAVRLTTSETGAPTTMTTTALRVISGSTTNLDFANLYVAIFR